jgi:hypothetical protein
MPLEIYKMARSKRARVCKEVSKQRQKKVIVHRKTLGFMDINYTVSAQ